MNYISWLCENELQSNELWFPPKKETHFALAVYSVAIKKTRQKWLHIFFSFFLPFFPFFFFFSFSSTQSGICKAWGSVDLITIPTNYNEWCSHNHGNSYFSMVRSTSTIKAAQEQGEIAPHAAINWEKHRVPCWDHISGAWWQGLEGMSSRWILGQSRDLGLFSTCGSPHGYFIYIQPLKQQKK